MALGPSYRGAPVAPSTGSLTFTVNGANVCVTGRGFFTDAAIDRHFEQLGRIVVSARPHHPCFNVLIDMRDSAVQTAATTVRIEAEARRIWTPGDRIAVVAHVGLAKRQLTRIVDGENHLVFGSIDEARRWLDAG